MTMRVNNKNVLNENIAPFILDIYLKVLDFFGKTSTRNNSWRYLETWLRELEKIRSVHNNDDSPTILVFSCTREWTDYMLVLSIIFMAKGYNVDFVWLPNVGDKPSDRYWIQKSNMAHRKIISKSLRLFNGSDLYLTDPTELMISIANEVAKIDTGYLLKMEPAEINYNDSKDATDLYNHRVRQNLIAIRLISGLLSKNNYLQAILPNGVVLEMGSVFRYLTLQGLPVSTLETWEKTGQIVYSSPGKYPVMDLEKTMRKIWEADFPHVLTKSRFERVQNSIQERKRFSKDQAYKKASNTCNDSFPIELRDWVGSDQLVLVCPNVPYDSAFYSCQNGNYFGSFRNWICQTIQYLTLARNSKVVVRCHPHERYLLPTITTEYILSNEFSELPEHIRIISPNEPVSTYDLMDQTKLGIVYASTTAIEMAIRGIPVVSALSVHYSQKGFTIDPASTEEYFSVISELLDPISASKLEKHQIDLAYCYADLYFKHFPFNPPIGGTGDFLQFCRGRKIQSFLSRDGLSMWNNFLESFLLKI